MLEITSIHVRRYDDHATVSFLDSTKSRVLREDVEKQDKREDMVNDAVNTLRRENGYNMVISANFS